MKISSTSPVKKILVGGETEVLVSFLRIPEQWIWESKKGECVRFVYFSADVEYYSFEFISYCIVLFPLSILSVMSNARLPAPHNTMWL